MHADNSTVYQFWPEIYPVMGINWMVLEGPSAEYKATYQLMRTRYGSQLLGANVSADLINTLVLLLNTTELYEIPYCFEGFVWTTDPFYEYILALPYAPLAVGEFNLDPLRELYSQGIGLFMWQQYYIRLAMQVNKLTVFGLRGRPPAPPPV